MNFGQKNYLTTNLEGKADQQKEFVLLALIGEDLVNLALFSVEKSETKLYSWARPQTWDGKDKESLLNGFEASWRLIPELENLPNLSVVFLISPFWAGADNTSVIETKKAFLAEICRQYKLKPLGFLLPDESLIRYYQMEEGELPSFISVFVGSQRLEISLIHLGKVKSRLRLEKKPSEFASQIEEALNKIDFQGMFPPNLIFWGNSEEWPVALMETVNNYQWVGRRESLFLHLPQILFLEWSEFFSYFRPLIKEKFSQLESPFEQNDVKEEEKKEVIKESQKPELPAVDKEIEMAKEPAQEGELPEGFSWEDISLAPKTDQDGSSKEGDDFQEKKISPEKRLTVLLKFLAMTKIIKSFVNKFNFNLNFGLKWKKGFLIGVILAAVIPFLNLYLVKNKIVVFVTPQVIEETKDFKFLTTVSEPDIQKGIFPATKIEVELEESGQVAVTGEKMIGEKAIGTVSLFNRTTKKADFSSGTPIVSDNGLEFFLKESVSIASKTADLESGVDRLGEVQVEVVAAEIGPDYNLNKGTIFSVQGFSQDEFVAKAKDDFSGGSIRKVKAVSADDLVRLREMLTEESKAKAKEALEAKKTANFRIISQKPESKLINFAPQRQKDEEAETLTGSLKMKFSVFAFDEEKFKNFVLEVIKQKSDQGSDFNQKTINFELKPIAQTEEEIDLKVIIKAKFYFHPDGQKLTNQLVRMKKSEVNKILRQYPRIYRFEVKTTPLFFRFWPWLSAKQKNISLEIKED